MSAGLSDGALAWMLDLLTAPYLQMHTGDPGADGTSNLSTVTVREAADLAETAPGTLSLASAVEWDDPWSGGEQVVTHLSAWDALSGGDFLFSVALTSHVTFANGMIPRVSALSVVVPTIATD